MRTRKPVVPVHGLRPAGLTSGRSEYMKNDES